MCPKRILSTPHAHTNFVDGKSTAEDMVRSAIRCGFQSLGFSEHAVQPLDPAYCLTDEKEAMYIREVARLKEQYGGQIAIYAGIERDAESTAIRSGFDYVLASSHYFLRGVSVYPVDGRLEDVKKCQEEFFQGDGMQMARAYYEKFSAYVEAYKPDIIGHFDLIRKQNEKARLFDTDSQAYRKITFDALERMIAGCDLLEVNTGGMARGYIADPYPQVFLLRRWREMGGRVIVSSDCHDAEKIDFGYDAAYQTLKDAGYSSAVALGPSEEKWVEYSL